MYLSYEEYQNMGGTLDNTAFTDCEMEAEAVINWYTFNRLKTETELSEDVKKCTYMLIKYIALESGIGGVGTDSEGVSISTSGANITSESNDGVSTSYNVLSASELMENAGKKIAEIVKSYLSGVVDSLGRKVLYRGLYPGE